MRIRCSRLTGRLPGTLTATLAATLTGVLVGCAPGTAEFRGSTFEPAPPIEDFTLEDQFGQDFRLADQRGRYVLLSFGYAFCPDVCPMTLSTWGKVQKGLGPDADAVRFVFVTVDPERDTPERLREHLSIFGEGFVGLSGAPEALEQVYGRFGIFHEKIAYASSATGYLVDHSTRMLLLDREGRLILSFGFDTPAEDIVHDLRILTRS